MRQTTDMLNIIPYPEKVQINSQSKSDILCAAVAYTKDPAAGKEGYRMEFDRNTVHIFFADDGGKFYAGQTLNQLRLQRRIPHFSIQDHPKYEYRGFSLDCARHAFKIEDIKKLIGAAALFKLNRFHWHLTDDQGWRIEMKSQKRLNEIGSARSCSAFGGKIDKREYRALYTQDEIREILAYCKERHIEVIPEIDIPGHASAILASYPNLSCTGRPVDVQTKQGIFNNILCVSREKVYSFVFSVLDEICELFPYEYIHIGGDETPTKSWENCPDCRRMKEQLGLKNFHELQSVFTNRIADHLKKKGKKAIVWNESLKGGMLNPEEICVQHWLGGNASFRFAEKGGKVIESDFFHYYCDYPFGMTPLKKTYVFQPEKNYQKCAGQKPYGIEAEIWTEYIRDFNTLCYRYFPRLPAISETAWGYKTSYAAFTERFRCIEPMLKKNGIFPAPEKERDLNPLLRVPDILHFFSGSLCPRKTKCNTDIK